MEKIDYLFLGLLYQKDKEKECMNNSKIGLQGAPNTFQWATIEGMKTVVEDLRIFNVLPVGTYPKAYKKIFLKTRKWQKSNIEIGSLNLPLIKQIVRSIKTYFYVSKWANSNSKKKEIIVYTIYIPYILALEFVKRRFPNITVKVIVTDLPGSYGTKKSNPVHRLYESIFEQFFLSKLDFVDGYVLLTEDMKIPLNVGNKKYVVVEGIIDEDLQKATPLKKEHEKIILYTGTLNQQYGIMDLVEAFMQIKNNSYSLWICGDGDAREKIQEAVKHDNRIKYYGYVTKERICELQLHAKVLINPRKDNDEYTKYSFPSKTMEYLAAKRPVIMYKLAGIPDNYDEYLYYVEGESNEKLREKIIEVLEMKCSLLNENAAIASEYVLNNKSKHIQAAKIINL